jgi:hypothetical protein
MMQLCPVMQSFLSLKMVFEQLIEQWLKSRKAGRDV